MPSLDSLLKSLEGQYAELQDQKDEYKEILSQLELEKARLSKRVLELEDKVSKFLQRIQSHDEFTDDMSIHWEDGEIDLREEDDNEG